MTLTGTMGVMTRGSMADPMRVAMVGRTQELDELRRLFVLADEGSPQIVVVGGEAGIGKSRLIAEFAATLPDHYTVETGGLYEESNESSASVFAVVPLMLLLML